MKYYEKLGLTTEKALEMASKKVSCGDCICVGVCSCQKSCELNRLEKLLSDVPTKPRIALINTKDKLKFAFDYYKASTLDNGIPVSASGFFDYLTEEVAE